MTKRRLGTAWIVAAVVVVAAVLLILRPWVKGEGGEEEEIVTDVGVHVGPIVTATLHRYVTAYGTVEPEPPVAGRTAGGALVSAPVGGILAEIACAEGQPVAAGALLFRLDTRLAEVAVAKAAKVLETAELNYERQKKLLAAEGTSQKAFEQAELERNSARSDLAAAKTELSLLEIRAPLAGTVVRIQARLGQEVEPNAALAEVVALDRLAVSARVTTGDAVELKPGQTVDWPGAAAPGRVLLVGRDIDPKTGTVLIVASIPAGAGFTPGQFVPGRVGEPYPILDGDAGHLAHREH
ncbi:MAG TPA: efflux RND transporter periplasmic adaptor subunit, partial [Candidatus Bathyarchaeia archaeon]|nr:efflux RND transporter periplasmic adaptor subunit [Candidatus Bathyarchaeia archaeon]